jgi:glyoxylase-like metal-dependent hydrolase (beta-lactamase superfamily II)
MMTKAALLAAAAVLILAPAGALPAPAAVPPPVPTPPAEPGPAPAPAARGSFEGTIVPVAEGVWAVLQPEALRFSDGNAAVVDLGDGLMVVDTFATPSRARALIAEMAKLTPKPVRWVVNTHFHGDHVQGNQAFEEAFPGKVAVIAHASAREEIERRAAPALAEEIRTLPDALARTEDLLKSGKGEDGRPLDAAMKERYRRGIERRRAYLEEAARIRFVLPAVTYEEKLDLHGGNRRVRLIHARAHTRGDTLVYLPAEKVLIAGDVVDALPYTGHGYPTEWMRTLKTLAGLEIETIIPGHGGVMKGKAQLDLVSSLLASAVNQMKVAFRQGKSLEEARKLSDLSYFRPRFTGGDPLADRTWDEFIPAVVERAYQEAAGTLDQAGP